MRRRRVSERVQCQALALPRRPKDRNYPESLRHTHRWASEQRGSGRKGSERKERKGSERRAGPQSRGHQGGNRGRYRLPAMSRQRQISERAADVPWPSEGLSTVLHAKTALAASAPSPTRAANSGRPTERRDDARRIAANIAKLPELSKPRNDAPADVSTVSVLNLPAGFRRRPFTFVMRNTVIRSRPLPFEPLAVELRHTLRASNGGCHDKRFERSATA